MALRRRLLFFLLVLSAVACRESSPTEPETRPVLVLSYTGPCTKEFVTVTIDRTAVGIIRIPGVLSWPLAAGTHTVQVGASPEFPVEMPADRDLVVTNRPSPCP